jgi:hypothetical protein
MKHEANRVPKVISETIVGQSAGPYITEHRGYIIYLDWTKGDVSIDPDIHAASDADREAILGDCVSRSGLSDQRIDRRWIHHARGRMYAAKQKVTIRVETF